MRIFLLLLIIGITFAYCNYDGRSDAEIAEDAARAAAEEVKAAAKKAEDKKKGFHCLSSWDGSHSAFKREVKSQMRDPDSFEHIKTRVTPVSDGTHTAIMEYRARNGFGGMTIGQAIATYRNSSCGHTVISIE